MSTIAHYFRATDATLESLRGKPRWIELLHASSELRAQVIDLDKAVFGLEWLLSRIPAPSGAPGAGFSMRRNLAGCLTGGGGAKEPALRSPIGPAYSLPPTLVRELEAWLRTIDLAALQPLFDPATMMADDVYPQVWDEPGILADYLFAHLNLLRRFLGEAASEGQSVLMFFL